MTVAVRRVGTLSGHRTADEGAVVDASDDFAGWVRPHWSAMQRLAGRLVRTADRDDVLQEALFRAWRKWHTYDPERGSPQVWLLAITADRARQAHRAGRPAEDVPLVDHADAALSSDLDLQLAVRVLADRRRLAVELYYYLGLPIAEVAAVMGCAEGTVKATLSAARFQLRGLLEPGDSTKETRDDG